MKFRPALFIGLGNHGCEIARRISTRIRQEDPLTAQLIGLLELRDDGQLFDGIAEKKRAQVDFRAAASHSEKFAAITAVEDDVERAIVDSLNRLRRREVLVQLREASYDVAEKTAIYFVAPIGDRIGSPALIAFVALVRGLSTRRLLGQELHRTVLGFFPDLFADQQDDEECYARTYVCLQELEFLGTPHRHEAIPYEFVSLFTARNEANEDLGSYENIGDLLGETFTLALQQLIAVDESFASAMAKTEEGMVTRYSSFGMASLVFPRKEICQALRARFATDVLRDYAWIEDKKFDRHVISVDVRKFISDDGLLRIEEKLKFGPDGKPIWKKFKTTASFSEDANVEETLKTLRAEADEYARTDVSGMTAQTREMRSRLLSEHVTNLATAVKTRLDSGGLQYARAFLDVFLNETSDFTQGDIVDDAVSVDEIDRDARRFFDDLFKINRADLSKFQQEINSKEVVLAQHEVARTAPGGDKDKELAATIEVTQKELKVARDKHLELDHKIKMHDLRLKDGAQRRQLLLQQRADMERKASEQAAEIAPLDDEYRTRRRAHAHEQEAYEERIRALWLYAGGLIAAVILLAIAIRYFAGPIENYVSNATKVGTGLLLIYAVWALNEWRRARARVVTAHTARSLAGARKREALGVLHALYETATTVTYEFARHGAAVDWASEFRASVGRLRDSVTSAQTVARELFERKVATSDFEKPSTVFMRTVASPDDLQRLLAKADRYAHERSRVRDVNNLSKVFESFQAKGDLSELEAEIERASAEVFAHVQTMSIEQFLLSADTPKRSKSTERMAHLFEFGAPLIQLRIAGSDDEFRNVSYFGSSQGEASSLLELARKLGRDPQVFRTRTDTEVVLVTTKVGFPAFQIALMSHCDQSLQAHADPESLKTVREWQLSKLVPSKIQLGNEEDPVRQLACQVLALGIVTESDQGMVFEDQLVGKSYRQFIESLRSARGTGLTARLQVKAAEAMSRENVADTLSGSLHHAQFDEIDQKIIQMMLDRLEDSF